MKHEDLYPQAVAWLRTCEAKFIYPGTLARRFGLSHSHGFALEEQLGSAGVLGPEIWPFNQRRNRVAKTKKGNKA